MECIGGEKIRQNLMDAGCDRAKVSDLFMINGNDKSARQLVLLSKHRKKLLYYT